jgi:hypothetical protein
MNGPCPVNSTADHRVPPTVSVTPTGRLLQTCVVKDGDRAAPVVDQTLFLQGARGFRDPHPPHAEHVREELVREMKLIAVSGDPES